MPSSWAWSMYVDRRKLRQGHTVFADGEGDEGEGEHRPGSEAMGDAQGPCDHGPWRPLTKLRSTRAPSPGSTSSIAKWQKAMNSGTEAHENVESDLLACHEKCLVHFDHGLRWMGAALCG